MAPVLAIAGMVARTVDAGGPLTPLERFSKPIVTGPNRVPFSTKGNDDDDRQKEAMAEPKREERMGAAIAIGGPGFGGGPSACGGDRCGQWRTLRSRTAGPRSRTGATV